MKSPTVKIIPLCTLVLASQYCLRVFAQENIVTVMTSYPQELISRYETAFEAAHPEIDMRVEWRRSDDAWELLQNSPDAGVDVYWAPSLDTFAAMAQAGYFTALDLPRAGLPGHIGDLLIDDPDGQYVAFEVAGFGFAYNQTYLDAHQLELPIDWRDLADPEYANSILMPVPSRQGFSPMIYESILQSSGWAAGWELITKIAGNSKLMRQGGGSFIDAIAEGSDGLALTIDFFPISAQANGSPVAFRYADTSLFSPAHVAILKKAPNSGAANMFTDFVLSNEGQKLLLHRDVARLPVRPSAYEGSSVYNPFTGAITVPAYDFDLTGARKTLLAALFDVQVTDRHEALVEAMSLLNKAEDAAGHDQAVADKLAEAKMLLTAPAIDAEDAEALLANLTAAASVDSATASVSGTSAELPSDEWTQILSARMEQATKILDGIVATHK